MDEWNMRYGGKLESPQNANWERLYELRWCDFTVRCQISLGRVDCDEVSRNSNEIVVVSCSKGEN